MTTPLLSRAFRCAALLAGLGTSLSAQDLSASAPRAVHSELTFVENRGQWPAEVAFQGRQGSASVWCETSGLVVGLELFAPVAADTRSGTGFPGRRHSGGVAFRLGFDGRAAAPEAEGPLPSRSHFRYPGVDVTGARHFDRVRYPELWPDVDAVVRRDAHFVAYDLELGATAELDAVTMSCAGVDGIAVDDHGRLVMSTAIGPVWQSAPVAWYEVPDGSREPVKCRFRILDATRYGFALDAPRRPLPLVVDPGLSWSTRLGGAARDWTFGMAVDAATGLVHVCGQTMSANYPTTLGPGFAGTSDAFVTVLNPNAPTPLVWSRFFGGAGLDWATRLDVSSGLIAVVGLADPGFPSFAAGAFQPTPQGLEDGYAMLLDPAGNVLSGTFLGGVSRDWALDVDATTAGRYAVLGCTASSAFSGLSGALAGGFDHFVLEWDPFATGVAQVTAGTFLGGSRTEGFYDRTREIDMTIGRLLVDRNTGDVLVCGRTESLNFPVSACPLQSTYAGGVWADAFLAILPAGLNGAPVYSTYCGSLNDDAFLGMDLHPAGGVVLCGLCWDRASWPQTVGAINAGGAGSNSAVVTWLDPTQCGVGGLLYGGAMGGPQGDYLDDVKISSGGTATFVGGSESLTGFPYTAGSFDPNPTGLFVPVAARMRFDGRGLLDLHYSSKFGEGPGIATAVHLDDRGNVTFGGMTMTPSYPTTPSPIPPLGGPDVVVTQLDLLPTGLVPPNTVSRTGPDTPACARPIYTGVDSAPQPGNANLHVNVTGAPPNTMAAVLIGAPVNVQLPSPFRVTQLVAPIGSVLRFTDALGYAELPLPVPATLAVGVPIDLQWAFLTTPTCPGTGLVAASDRMRL